MLIIIKNIFFLKKMKKFMSPWSVKIVTTTEKNDPNVTTFVNLGNTPVVVNVDNGLFKNYQNSIDLSPSEV